MDIELIGKNIESIRMARGFTKKYLAGAVGVSQPTVQAHISSGNMNMRFLVGYAEALGVKVSDLVEGAADPEKFTLERELCDMYPWNIAATIWGDTSNDRLYQAYIPGLLEAVGTLSELEKRVMSMRYEHDMTLEDCGKALNVTRERVRQIEVKALRKLSLPRIQKTWRMDDRTMEKAYEIMDEASRIRLEAIRCMDAVSRQKEAIEEIYKLAKDAMATPTTDEKTADISIPIEDLELSVRSYNCLCRAGVKTVGDILKTNLYKVRNLGKKSKDEIEDKLREMGVMANDQ